MSQRSSSNVSQACIENLYFSLNFLENHNEFIDKYIQKLIENQNLCMQCDGDYFIAEYFKVLPRGIQRYQFGFEVKDKYRIYISQKVGSNKGIYVIMNAVFLHLNNVFDAIMTMINDVKKLFIEGIDKNLVANEFYMYSTLTLSRIDICNHNNFIDMNKYIDLKYINGRIVTKLKKVFPVIDLVGEEGQDLAYLRFGSGDFVVRFYNKTKEVCEMKYKGFFFEKWKQDGLIDDLQEKIYKFCYVDSGDYNVNFLYANIIYQCENALEVTRATDIYNNIKLKNEFKYDELNNIIKENKIKLVREIVNVEYQLRRDFLKTIKDVCKISKNDKGEKIYEPLNVDFTNIYSILEYIQEIYYYLTDKCFRVVDLESKAARKRDKGIDKYWKIIMNSKIHNVIDNKYDSKYYEIVREYQKEMDKLVSTKVALSRLAHVLYMNSNFIDVDSIKDISMDDYLITLVNEVSMNENYFNLEELMLKQLKYYGKKGCSED